MHILVVGNQGYIGTVMVEELIKIGHKVKGYDTRYFELNHLANSPNYNKIEQIQKDTRHVNKDDLKDIDAIFYFAALANDPGCDLNPRATDEINHKATVKFAQFAKEAGIRRFVFSSSCSVYGVTGKELIKEDTQNYNPISLYAAYKLKTERELSKVADKLFSPCYMRNATAFGLSPRMRFDIVVNNMTGWAFTTGKVKMLSDGSSWRPNVHIKDICAAFIATLNEDEDVIRDQSFNIGMPSETKQIKEVAQIISEVTGCQVEVAKNAVKDQRSYNVDCTKAIRVLKNFKPKWTIKMGVEEIYNALKEKQIGFEQFNDNTFHTVKRLTNLINTKQIDEGFYWIKK